MKDVAAAMYTQMELWERTMHNMLEIKYHVQHPKLPHQDYTTQTAMHTGVLRAQELSGMEEMWLLSCRVRNYFREVHDIHDREEGDPPLSPQQMISRPGPRR